MRAVIQRVSSARVEVDGETVGEIGRGVAVLLGVAEGDSERDAVWLADKVAGLRIFEDNEGKMSLSVRDVDGGALVVSQFTLLGDCRKGRRPSFSRAAAPQEADALYERCVHLLRERGIEVATGVFRAMMDVHLVNEGPVTLLLDSRKEF
ncbi:MAG: D-tyrosyl-tRNA(Tyr) deacylase [Desulfuromonadales bacterium]|nr:D-tyrosyl-tRNA(Tyr) deacylase [Desulfuromonadales bacterium]NIS43423.1 D-tyrosyl-tRNA(Tyr) deacylase [Desulfuromonadales bacterium]